MLSYSGSYRHFVLNGIAYLPIDETKVRVLDVEFSETETLRVPEMANGYIVSEIDMYIGLPKNVLRLEIPLSVEEIKERAFQLVYNLKNVHFYKPETIPVNDTIRLSKEAFYFCEHLEEVSAEIETNLEIGMGTFDRCRNLHALTNFVISKCITPFLGQTRIKELTIADNAKLYRDFSGTFFRWADKNIMVRFKGNFDWKQEFGLKRLKLRIPSTSNFIELVGKEGWNIEVIS